MLSKSRNCRSSPLELLRRHWGGGAFKKDKAMHGYLVQYVTSYPRNNWWILEYLSKWFTSHLLTYSHYESFSKTNKHGWSTIYHRRAVYESGKILYITLSSVRKLTRREVRVRRAHTTYGTREYLLTFGDKLRVRSNSGAATNKPVRWSDIVECTIYVLHCWLKFYISTLVDE